MTNRTRVPSSLLLYAWPLRFPILTGVFLLLFPWLALQTGASVYLAGLFDVLQPNALFLVALQALLTAWTAMLTGRLVLAYGGERLDLPKIDGRFFPVPFWVWAVGFVMAMPVIITTIAHSAAVSSRSIEMMAGFSFAGMAVACVLLVAVLWLADVFAGLGQGWYEKEDTKRTIVGKSYQAVLDRVADSWLGPGFVTREQHQDAQTGVVRTNVILLRGHGLATALAVATFVVYVTVGVITSNLQEPRIISTIACLLTLVALFCWVLSFLAFVADRTRVPVFVFVGAAALITSYCGGTDHYYETHESTAATNRASAEHALGDRSDAPIIVVAASGGGIQAAAWTAQVLSGLDEVAAKQNKPFRRAVRLISAVSGGSVGTMYYMASLPECGPAGIKPGPYTALDNAKESSLHAVAWGLIFRDLNITPFWFNIYTDRGLTLETAWRRDRRLKEPEDKDASRSGRPALPGMFLEWSRGIAAAPSADRSSPLTGGCPGIVFNAMVSETGFPLLFSTIALPDTLGDYDFHTLYEGRDVPMTTAARLSATFPYVSPAATADVTRGLHVVDGGYYDNYGMATLTRVLDHALSAGKPSDASNTAPPARRVLIIEIRGSEFAQPRRPEGYRAPSWYEPAKAGGGWTYQAYAPLYGLANMRGVAQGVHNITERCLLEKSLRTKASVASIDFTFPDNGAPLSWHLSELDKVSIQSVWDSNGEIAKRKKDVMSFLAGDPVVNSEACPGEARAGADPAVP